MSRILIAALLLGAATAAVAAEDKERAAAVALAKKTLSGKLGAAADTVQLEKAEAFDWPDTSLGCPEKGMMYAQVIMSGYKVQLKVEGKPHTVHVAGTRAVMCGGDAKRPALTETKK